MLLFLLQLLPLVHTYDLKEYLDTKSKGHMFLRNKGWVSKRKKKKRGKRWGENGKRDRGKKKEERKREMGR